MQKRKILVTGSEGFVGKALVKHLKKSGHDILTFSLSKGNDITKPSHFKDIPTLDSIIHLAALTSIPDSWENPKKFFGVNVGGTLNILEFARKQHARIKVVLAGAYVYGHPSKIPISEQSPTNANNPYSLSKLESEHLGELYSKFFDFPVTVLRCFNVYGQNQSENFLIPTIIRGIKSGKIVLQSSKPKRDYVYVDDVVGAYSKAESADLQGFSAINIAFGKSYSVEEVAEKLIKKSNQKVKLNFTNSERKSEIKDTRAKITKAKRLLNWQPKIDIDEGLQKIVDHYFTRAS